MAAPKRNASHPDHPLYEKTRSKIQISQLATRLENNALGSLKSPQGDPIEMTTGQIASAKILLDKTLPNLSALDATSNGETIAKPPEQLTDEEILKLLEDKTK